MHRKPTVVHELSGAFKKNPDRGAARKNEPVPRGPIGPPPARLTEDEAQAWNSIVSVLPLGVAYESDRIGLEITAVLLARFWRDKSETPGTLIARLENMLARFGLYPSDRSKIMVPDAQAKNPFGAL